MHQINVSASSWHYNLYRWWATNSPWYRKYGRTYKENLCHYVRVILFWAPLLWFFSMGRIPIWKGEEPISLKPWELTFLLSLFVGEIALVVWVPPLGWTVIGVILLIIVVVLGAAAYQYLHERYPKAVENTLIVVFFPIWFPIFLAVKAHELWHGAWYTYVYRPLVRRHLHWVTRIVNGWGLLISVGLILFATLLDWSVQLEILKLIGILALIVVSAFIVVAICVGLVMGVKWLWYRYVTVPRRLARAQSSGTEPDAPKLEKGTGMARMTWIWVKEAKLGSVFCPLMKLPEQPDQFQYGGLY